MAIDYRPINDITLPDYMPLERQEDLRARAAEGNVLSLTTFRTHRGIYQYKRMPFGLKAAGATFARVLLPLLAHLAFVAVDSVGYFSCEPVISQAFEVSVLQRTLEVFGTHCGKRRSHTALL